GGDADVFMWAFDLIELNGDDLRRDPLEFRKGASILAKARPGIRFNEHIEGDGPTVFAHACKMGLGGIVWKRKDSASRFFECALYPGTFKQEPRSGCGRGFEFRGCPCGRSMAVAKREPRPDSQGRGLGNPVLPENHIRA